MSTLPKKTSRPITINGREYRWMVKTTVDKDTVRLTVQDVKTGETHQRDVRDREGLSPPPVTSATVKEFILVKFPV
jgi:hypothetical protein